ncbi:kinase non-catalytic C-lobe domain-containing protein 1 isoform X2 [Gadus morhua]|uniref:kinase non-catalytic C-lobe domain-containing protein 1 isoform X2 n=1 Tax=Gadus morhua TaxID=8049 RepID=UPI0011B43D92|nr:kinase non-catalytic C-lobe domain-containing protein 1 isoform X2 [Gadus morhua]
METFDHTVRYLGRDGRECFSELEHLPPLLEDEENVSLADILCLRDSCLTEEEVWAMSGECVLALRSIQPTQLFHSLCITPDTLAFNAHGNVCFMEQLSDDVEGSFVPPEFDHTGSTFEGHVFSLGSTLSAALDFVIEPELQQAELGEEALRMLELMQAELPDDRPRPQDILAQAEQKLAPNSSSAVCRKLSSVGRRVLSLESVSNFNGASDDSWEARWQHAETRSPFKSPVSEGDSDVNNAADGVSRSPSSSWRRRRACEDPWDPYLWAADMEDDSAPMARWSGPPPPQGRSSRGVLNRSCSVPDSNNPPSSLAPAAHGDISVPVSDLTEIGPDEDEPPGRGTAWSGAARRRRPLDRGQSCECYPMSWEYAEDPSTDWRPPPEDSEKGAGECTCRSDAPMANGGGGEGKRDRGDEGSPVPGRRAERSPGDDDDDGGSLGRLLYAPNNHMTKSMLCLNEETQDEWISLRELLPRCGRRLRVNELWALCYTCLATLQTYIDFPAYLCLDTVYVGCEGEVLFLKPKNVGSCDAFYLAPEFQDHGIMTEKACVYGVAAILWATAKFSLSANQKLAMPRQLKRLLMEMARRTPIERPSIVMAKKSCRDYLSRQGTTAETVWTKLIDATQQQHLKSTAPESHIKVEASPTSPEHSPAHITSGFVPLATESRLAPVHGPVPHSYPTSMLQLQLPEAFTSSATHFSPIILTQEERSEEEGTSKPGAAMDGTVDLASWVVPQPKQEGGFVFTSRRDNSSLTQTFVTHLDVAVVPDGHADGTARMISRGQSSSQGPLLNPISARSDTSQHRTIVSLPVASASAHLNRFKNYLLCQDLTNGHLTLVPVRYPTPASNTTQSTELYLGSTREQQTIYSKSTKSQSVNGLTGSVGLQPQSCLPDFQNLGPSDGQREHAGSGSQDSDGCLGDPPGSLGPLVWSAKEVDGEPPELGRYLHPALREVIDLLKGESDHEGCMENSQEGLAMGIGEYIFSLKDLQYQSFATLVRERFSDLYWEEDLLGLLHCLVSSSPAKLGSNGTLPSASISPVSPAVQTRGARDPHLRHFLDLNGNLHFSGPAAQERSRGTGTTTSSPQVTGPMYQDLEETSEELPDYTCSEVGAGGGLPEEMEVTQGEERSAGGGHESPASEDRSPSGRHGGGGGSGGGEGGEGGGGGEGSGNGGSGEELSSSPGCPDDMEDDSGSLGSSAERRPSPGGGWDTGPGPDLGPGADPSWALAYYGEDYFGTEVVRYAQSLGQHSGSACLDVKAQELQQQLVIENRHLKKTRNFYQKLLQQDRKKKGSESKLMLGRVSTQLEELRSKVEFLYSVKKYLKVLQVDQWGLEVALLPALADHHLGALERPDPGDPAVLSFGPQTGRGRSTLQAGSPKGLMAHLYARDAALNGYIQQLLYTYRYFCTSEQLLRFLMDRFIAAARGPDISGSNMKVLHRTLDLLEAWLIDCKLVDWTLSSSILTTLENFLNAEVVPVDSRGETLLATLHSPPRKRRSQGSDSPISPDQDNDSFSMHSSFEDAEKRHCTWRISRVVEPQEKAFCIAAVLPMPSYGSLLSSDPSSGFPRSQELPFSLSPCSAQSTAQQLTLLQQEVFLGCHPVHFLNSRAKGVRDYALSPNKNVCRLVTPAEGSSLFAGEETSPSDGFLQRLLAYADSVSDWIAAEIVSSDSFKAQAAVMTKFLLIGKHCYESRDFATAMQVLAGLENVIVRQLPAWKHLSSKVCEVMEELRAVQVFLKSDDLCLMGGEQARRGGTLPSARILAMHVQQLEIGAFTLATGAYKWTKLRSIARVVSQVQAFQESVYPYSPERQLQGYLRRRIQHLSGCDLHLLAADNDANFQQPSAQRHVRHIQETLRRVRGNFQ